MRCLGLVAVLGACSPLVTAFHSSDPGTPDCFDSVAPPLVDLALTVGAIGASAGLIATAHGNHFAGIDWQPSYGNLPLFFMMISLPPMVFGASTIYGFRERWQCHRVEEAFEAAENAPASGPTVAPNTDAMSYAHELAARGSKAAAAGDCATAKQLALNIHNLDGQAFAAYARDSAVAACLQK